MIDVKHGQCCNTQNIQCGDNTHVECIGNTKSFEDCMILCFNAFWCKQFSFDTEASRGYTCWLESNCLNVDISCGNVNRYQIMSNFFYVILQIIKNENSFSKF